MSIPEQNKKINPVRERSPQACLSGRQGDRSHSGEARAFSNGVKLESEYEEIDLDEVKAHYGKVGDSKAQNSGMTFWNENKKNLITIAIIILVGTGSYGLGMLSKIEREREPVQILKGATSQIETVSVPTVTISPKENNSLNSASVAGGLNKIEANMLVGSKSGDKYHFPWCSGAQRIKNENKVWFSSPEEARKAGYTPASNCKGLK